MNLPATFLTEPWVQRLGWVLIHFLWQGVAIALLLAVLLRFLSHATSHARYLAMAGALLLCGVMPVATWLVLDSSPVPVRAAIVSSPVAPLPPMEKPAATSFTPSPGTVASLPDEPRRTWPDRLNALATTALPYLVSLWFIGVLILTLRLTLGWTLMQRLRLSGVPIEDSLCVTRFQNLLERMQVSVPVRLLQSALVEVPTLIGWLRPTILVPASVFIGLTPEQLDAILAHELAHVRRYDYLVNLFQTFIETVLFYHPAVWWISRKLREERENCCDDIALEVMQDRLVYVSALAQLEERRCLPLALSASGGSLLQRIRRIVGGNERKVTAWPLWILVIALLCVGCLSQQSKTDKSSTHGQTLSNERSDELSSLRIGNLNTKDFPLDQFINRISGQLKEQDPKKQGFDFILKLPPGEPPLRLSLDFAQGPKATFNIWRILDFLKLKYPIRYHYDERTITVEQQSQQEIAFRKKAVATKISLYFDHTKPAAALAAIQSAAAEKGFAFDLTGLDSIKARDAAHANPGNLVTLEADPLSVDQALRSVFYLGRIDATPLTTSPGFRLEPSSEEAIQKQAVLQIETQISAYMILTRKVGDMKVQHLQSKPLATQILFLKPFSGQSGSIETAVNGPDHVEKYQIDLHFSPEIIDKTVIQITSTVSMSDPTGKKVSELAGQWRRANGFSANLIARQGPLLLFPGADTDDGLLPVGSDTYRGINLSVEATLLDEEGKPLLPLPYPSDEHFGNVALIPTMSKASTKESPGPPPEPFLTHATDTDLITSIDRNEDMSHYTGKITPEGMAEALGTGQNHAAQAFWNRGSHDCSALAYAISHGAPLREIEAQIKIDTSNPVQDRLITPLAVAVENGNLDAVRLLLDKGADPNKGETSYLRPLARAAAIIRPDLVELLLHKGAHPESPVLFTTIGSAAVSACQPHLPDLEKITKMLIDAGAVKGLSEFEAYILLLDAGYTAKNPAMLQMLLDAGLKPSSKGDKGKTVLEYIQDAYAKRETETWNHGLKRMLDLLQAADKGAKTTEAAKPNAGNANAQMIEAVQKGDAVTLQKLIDQGTDPNKIQNYDQPLLFSAGSPEVAEILIAHGADPKAVNKRGDGVLSTICFNGGKNTAATIRVLLEHGADPNFRNGPLKTTPIMGAHDGNTVDVLVQYGADVKAVDSGGDDALFWSTWQDVSTFEALLRHGISFDPKKDGPTILLHATWNGNIPLITSLLARGVDPNSSGVWVKNNGHPDDMMLPICATAISGQPKAAKLLLEHGVKGEKATPLALQNNYNDIVKLLREHGVQNLSELCYAISQKAPLADLEKMLTNGTPVDPPQDAIITPLGEAANTGSFPAVQLLVKHGADVNKGGNAVRANSDYRNTPLVLAAKHGQEEIVAYLLQHGAKPDPAAVESATIRGIPNDFYVKRMNAPSPEHYERVIQMLIDAGALKNPSPESSGRILAQVMSPCWGDPDPAVMPKLLAAGLNPESPMSGLEERGEKPNSVIGYYRDYIAKNKDLPDAEVRVKAMQPLQEMMEAAVKGVKTTETLSSTPETHLVQGKLQIGDPSLVDFAKSKGELISVDGINVHHFSFSVQPDGTFTIPGVADDTYNPVIHWVRKAQPDSKTTDTLFESNLEPISLHAGRGDLNIRAKLSGPFMNPAKGSIQMGLQVLEINDAEYLANQEKMDEAADKADIEFFNNQKGVSMLSTPNVTTLPGQKANIDILRKFPYPIKFDTAEVIKMKSPTGSETGTTGYIPPTPTDFVTKDLGVSAEITPTIDAGNSAFHGKIILNGKFSITNFEGFTKSNFVSTGMPVFSTRESLFYEALDDHQSKGIWIPGNRFAEETVTEKDNAGKVTSEKKVQVKKRLLLFVSANVVK